MKKGFIRVIILGCAITFLGTSCPGPISVESLLHLKDTTGPVVKILSPIDGAFCAQSVVVTGTVSDLSSDSEDIGKVRSLRYEILSTDMTDDIEFDENGVFEFSFSTSSLASTFVVRVSAEDWNGNAGDVSFTLNIADGNDITSFTAESGSKQISLAWDSVPFSEGYTLYYTTNGTQPSEYYGSSVPGVTSPFSLTGLNNGSLHVLRLKSDSSEGDDNWSDYIPSIPLSENTLAPEVVGDLNGIRVSWNEIAGTDQFEIWRSAQKEGPFINISGSYSGYEFFDSEADRNSEYFYRVTSSRYSDVISLQNSAVACPFPEDPFVHNVGTERAWNTVLEGNYAYVADSDGGLVIIDISDPENAVIVKTVPTTSAWDVALSGDYAYVSDGPNGDRLLVVNISDPENASIVHEVSLPNPYNLAIYGNYVYVACTIDLYIIDISTPESAVDINYVRDIGNFVAYDVAVSPSGDYAYVSGSTSISVVDIGTPGSESIAHTVPIITDGDSGYQWGLALKDGYAYVATDDRTDDSDDGITVIDIDPPLSAAVAGVIPAADPIDVTVNGDYAYIAAGAGGVAIADISNPLSASVTRTISSLMSAQGFAVSGDYGYISDSYSGLTIVDISDPINGEVINTITGGGPQGIALSEGYAYIADGVNGMRIVDVSDPENFIDYGRVSSTKAYAVEVVGNYAYVADGTGGLAIFDISTASSASLVHSVSTPGSGAAEDLDVYGDYLYLAAGSEGVLVIDISNPLAASIVHTVFSTDAQEVVASGDYLYLADNDTTSDGLKIIDISDPVNASVTGTLAGTTKSCSVAVSGNTVFVAGQSGTFEAVHRCPCRHGQMRSRYPEITPTRLLIPGG